MAVVCAVGVFARTSFAQTASYSTFVTLEDGVDSYDLGPFLYVTRDTKKVFSYKDIVERHMAGSRGNAVKGDILNISASKGAHWIIFSATNKSWNEKWVLSLGQHMDGRIGLLQDIFVYDHEAKVKYVDNITTTQNPYIKSDSLENEAVFMDIPRGEKAMVVIYVTPKPGMPSTIAPQLMTENAYLQKLKNPVGLARIVNVLFVIMVGFFAAAVFFRQMLSGLLFIAFYVCQFGLFHYQNSTVLMDFPLATSVPGILFTASVVIGLMIAKGFLGIGKLQRLQGRTIFGFAAGITVTALVAAFIIGEGSAAQTMVMYMPPLLAVFFIFMLALAQGYNGQHAAYQFGFAWLFMLIGSCMTVTGLMNVFTPTPVLVAGYWYGLLPQAFLFVSATVTRYVMEEHELEQIQEEELQEEESLEYLNQSKTASENARLLRLIEHERQVMNELREREMQQNEEMRKAKEAADDANRSKSAFLAVVSHEIRTPMTGILGMVRLLLDTKLTKDQSDYAQTIQDSGDAMMALLNDILDFEKIESGKMDLEHVDFDLHRLLNGIRTLMSGHAEAKGLYLKIDMDDDVPRYVVGDSVRLRQVILNLTGNSIKFTQEGGVTIRIKNVTADGSKDKNINRLRFAVEDTGIGISKEAQKNLFNPFEQADTSITRKFGGTGLGLAISQRLIEAMGGKIEIDSTEGSGSTFFFTVLLETGDAGAAGDARQQQRVSKTDKALKILVTEDNEINQKLLKELIDRMGHQTTLAGSGEEALEKMAEDDFEMVLMDIELPGMTGMGTTKAIRALPDRKKAAVPVIALTGNVRDEDVRQCYAANMNGHLAKPVDPKKLEGMIAKVTEGNLDNPVELPEETQEHLQVTRLDELEDKEDSGDEEPPAGKSEDRGGADAPEMPPLVAERPQEIKPDETAAGAGEDAPADDPADDSDEDAHEEGDDKDDDDGAEETAVAPIKAWAMQGDEDGDDDEEDDSDADAETVADMAAGIAADEEPFSMELTEEDLDEDSFETALKLAEENEATEESGQAVNGGHDSDGIFDEAMLGSLKSSMDKTAFAELIRELFVKADEILDGIESARGSNDIEAIASRAHELKGMAGNFGLREVSRIAARAEKVAKEGEGDEGLEDLLEQLPAAQKRAKSALEDWVDS